MFVAVPAKFCFSRSKVSGRIQNYCLIRHVLSPEGKLEPLIPAFDPKGTTSITAIARPAALYRGGNACFNHYKRLLDVKPYQPLRVFRLRIRRD
jgi:hypothetical protein